MDFLLERSAYKKAGRINFCTCCNRGVSAQSTTNFLPPRLLSIRYTGIAQRAAGELLKPLSDGG